MFEGLVTIGILALGVIIWSVRQEGRINSHERLLLVIDEKFELTEKRARELREDILYIRQRIDEALLNGRWGRGV